MTNPVYTQVTFRVRNDDGSQTTATWRQTQGVNDFALPDTSFRVRFRVQGTASWTGKTYNIYYSKNAAAYAAVTTSTPIKKVTSANYTDGADTTTQLTGGTGTYLVDNNGMRQTGTFTNTSGVAGIFEIEFCLQIDGAQNTIGDTFALRIYDGTTAFATYTVTPSILTGGTIARAVTTAGTSNVLAAGEAASSRVKLIGWEVGDLTELVTVDGELSVDSTVVHGGGGFSLKRTSSGTSRHTQIAYPISLPEIYVRGYHRFSSDEVPSGDVQSDVFDIYDVTHNLCARISHYRAANGYNYLRVIDQGGDFAGGMVIIPTVSNRWYRWECYVYPHSTTGIIRVWIDGDLILDATGRNTFGGPIARVQINTWAKVAPFYDEWFDDYAIDRAGLPGPGEIIARQFKVGTPTYNAWTKTGGVLPDIWNDTPNNSTTHASSSTSSAAQTALTASFAATQAGHGTGIVRPNDIIHAAKVGFVAAAGSDSAAFIRRRFGGVNTDTPLTLTNSYTYYQTNPFPTNLNDLNASELGVVHGAHTVAQMVADAWVMVEYLPQVVGLADGTSTADAVGATIRAGQGLAIGTAPTCLAVGTAIKSAVGTVTIPALGFSPANIAGLLLWIDAADTATITHSGGKVSVIANKGSVGGSFTQANAAKQFTLAATAIGQALQNLSAGEDFFMSGGTDAAYDIAEMTAFGVAYRDGTAGAYSDLLGRKNQTGDGWYFGWSWAGTTASATLVLTDATSGYTTSDRQSSVSGAGANRPFWAALQRGPTAMGGTTMGQQFTLSGTYGVYAAPVGAYPIVLGGEDNSVSGSFGKWRGNIHEVLLYNRALSTSEIYAIDGYLAWKWGLQGEILWAGHPYKNAPPGQTGVGASAIGASVVTVSGTGTVVIGDADFSPAQIPGLTVRLDASQLGLADGGAVSSWPNLSGTAPSIVGSPAPVFRFNRLNGWPIVEFTVNQGRVRGTHGLTYDYTALYIGRARGNGRVFTAPMTGRLGPNLPNFLVGFWGTQEDCMYDNGWLAAGTAVSPYPTSWRLYEADCSGPAASNVSRFFKNGTYLASNTAGLGCGPDGGYALSGDFPNTPEESADCDVAEVLIYSRKLSDAERQAVEGYLAWKWGLQANLPVGHLYKDAKPAGPGGVSVRAVGTAIRKTVGFAAGGAQRTGFDLTSIPNLLLWLDISDNATITQSGGRVSAVTNKGSVGGSFTQPTPSKQHELVTRANGQAIYDPGFAYWLGGDTNSVYDIRDITVACVARHGEPFAQTHVLTRSNSADNDGWRFSHGYSTGGGQAGATNAFIQEDRTTGGPSTGYSTFSPAIETNRASMAVFKREEFLIGGSAAGQGFLSSTNVQVYAVPVGDYRIILGGWDRVGTGPGSFWRGDIHEVLLYNRPLTVAEIRQVEGYFAWKWKLAVDLPVTHPYKGTPPGSDTSALAIGQAVTSSTGSAVGISTVSGALAATIAQSASAVGSGTASASGASTATSVAGAAGTSNVLATGAARAAAVGVTAGASSVSAVGTGVISVAGNAAGSSAVVAVGIGIVTISSVGNVAGSGDVVGTGRALSAGPSPGTVVGTSAVVAVGRAITALVGTASGTSGVTAVGLGVSLTTGTAGGAATVSAIGAAQFDAIGEAGGISEAIGDGQAFFYATGEAAGQAIVYGEGTMSMTAWPMGVQAVGMVGNASVLWGIMVNRPPGVEEIWSGVPLAPQSPWVPVVPPGTEVWRPVVT